MSCSDYRGTRAFLSVARAAHGFDEAQAQSVYHRSRAKARVAQTGPTVEQWQALVDAQTEGLLHLRDLDDRKFTHLYRYLKSVREDAPPDATTFAALREMPLRAEKAQSAIRRQIHAAAALRGVTAEAATERFHAYRAQYINEYRRLPAAERPDPPADWVEGYKKRDTMAVSSPGDKATLYAMYRCQADPEAFPYNPDQRFASIDLETAGPEGRAGFDPANGSIIEVGIVECDPDGLVVDRYSQLIAPAPEVAAVCGTGAVAVHGITPADVADAPDWADVAPEVGDRLTGRVMLAQNSRFERDWLDHHMSTEGQPFEKYGPTVDTMLIAKQHFTLPNHRLETICARVGVAYTNGHRAEHDAEVAAQAFFKMRREITSIYLANPVRAAAPQPPHGLGRTRHASALTRLTAGDFDPATVPDPWATPTAPAA